MIIYDAYGNNPRLANGWLTAQVTEELDGAFEFTGTCSAGSSAFQNLSLGKILYVKPNSDASPEPFRVRTMTADISGVITVYAQHMSYDLSGERLLDDKTYTGTPQAIATAMLSDAGVEDWTVTAPTTGSNTVTVEGPCSLRSALLSDSGLRGVAGLEISYLDHAITLSSARGENRAARVTYAWNMTAMTNEDSTEDLYTSLICYWRGDVDEVETLIESDEVWVVAAIDCPERCLLLDVSSEYDEAPTTAVLTARAKSYIASHGLGLLFPGLTATCIAEGQKILLGDTVTATHPRLGISASMRITKVVYDVLAERETGYELGDPTQSIADWLTGKTKPRKGAGTLRTGRVTINGVVYRYADGVAWDGWHTASPNYYYAYNRGRLAIGWHQCPARTSATTGTHWYYFAEDGDPTCRMLTGWQEIYCESTEQDEWYWMDSDDGYMWAGRFKTSGDYTYYLKANGIMARSETLTIEGETWTFDSDGHGTKVS